MAHYQLVAFTNPVAGREDEYNAWYDGRHLPDVLAVPGFVAAQRFKVADDSAQAAHRYLAIYDIESDDVGATMERLMATVGTPAMMISDAMDASTVTATLYAPITPKLPVPPRGQQP